MKKYSSQIITRLSKTFEPLIGLRCEEIVFGSIIYRLLPVIYEIIVTATKFVHSAMVDINTFRKLALSFPEATEQAHFEKPSFRVAKKIFATFDAKNNIACIKLSAVDQDVFCAFDKSIIYPVPNKFGSQQGWTFINLKKIRKDMFTDALTTAYIHVAPKKLVALMK